MREYYDISVIIGRFQPFHNGHLTAFARSEEISDYTVCIVGSANKPSTPQNPFSLEERTHLILASLDEEGLEPPITIAGVEDSFYCDQEWIRKVRHKVQPFINMVRESRNFEILDELYDDIDRLVQGEDWDMHLSLHGRNSHVGNLITQYRHLRQELEEVSVCILGYEKDESSYYMYSFGDWDVMDVGAPEVSARESHIDATTIRDLWLDHKLSFAMGNISKATYDFLTDYPLESFLDLQEERDFINEYIKENQVGPHPVQFLTSDPVVVHGDEILLIKRGKAPGKGQWALPGGIKEYNENFFDGCLRELREETRIALSEAVLRGARREEHMFDYPKRSSRGTTVSMAYLFVLDPTKPRPRVKGGDDAVQAWWFSLSDIEQMRDQMFEDHPDIIKYMTARL